MITLTDKATSKVAQLIKDEGDNGLALRVGVRPGGCSGLSYEMYFDTDISDTDVKEVFGSVTVISDTSSASLLNGATLDYHDGLDESGFKITNTQAQRTCGCGQSFC